MPILGGSQESVLINGYGTVIWLGRNVARLVIEPVVCPFGSCCYGGKFPYSGNAWSEADSPNPAAVPKSGTHNGDSAGTGEMHIEGNLLIWVVVDIGAREAEFSYMPYFCSCRSDRSCLTDCGRCRIYLPETDEY